MPIEPRPPATPAPSAAVPGRRRRRRTWALALAGGMVAGLILAPSSAAQIATQTPALTAAQTAAQSNQPTAQPDVSTTDIPDDTGDLVPVGHPARELTVEGESLAGRLVADRSTAAVSIGGQLGTTGFSGDRRMILTPAAAGDAASFRLTAPASGEYRLLLDVLTTPTGGSFTVAVGGTPVGPGSGTVIDTRGATSVRRQVDVGVAVLTAGTDIVTVTAVAKDDAVQPISIDLVHFAPVPQSPAVFPADGAVVKGVQRVTGIAGGSDPLTLNGAAVADAETTPGSGSASLTFASSDFQGRSFPNYLEVAGVQVLAPNTARTTAGEYTSTGVTIPAALLQVGENTVRVAAGGSDSSCGVNYDDFRIRDVRLTLPGGVTVQDAARTPDVLVGDGSCGSNTALKTFQDYRFDLTAEQLAAAGPGVATGVTAALDTTRLPDGAHTLGLGSARSRIVVDNTPPVIGEVSFTSGQLLKGTQRLTADADDATSAIELTATLDGVPVRIGDVLDSDELSLGSHELVVTATDAAHNATSRTIVFDAVPERPLLQGEGAPVDGATGVSTSPVLRSTWRDPTRERLTVDFHAAGLSAPSRATRGQVTEIPDTRGIPGAAPVGVGAVRELDGRSLRSTTSAESPVQTFELPVVGRRDGLLEVRWDGTVDAQRAVALHAWDTVAGRWTEIGRTRGSADGAVVTIRGTVSADVIDDRTPGRPVVHALVQGVDTFDRLVDDPVDEQFKDPAEYAFAMSWMTDTQYLAAGATRPGGENQQVFADTFTAMTDWIADNARARKIVYSAHTGDVTETWSGGDGSDPAQQQQAAREFAFASKVLGTLDARRIPNGVLPGNHDNLAGTSDVRFSETFGADRYRALSQRTAKPFYGGNFGAQGENRGVDNSNHFDLFTHGGQDFIVLYLGYGVTEDETIWANKILSSYSDRNAILATHDYLVPSNKPDASDAPRTTEGQYLYDSVVSRNDNVFLVLAGHTHGMGLNVLRDVARPGHHVVEMLADRQFFEIDGQRRDGFLRLLQFDLERGEMAVNTYSPYLQNHNSVEFDTQPGREYAESVDEFTVPIDISSRTTVFATDAIRLAAEQPGLIGSDRVRTNEEAHVTWAGLQPHTRYGWFTRATDSDTGVATSPVFTFVTGDGTAGSDGADRGRAAHPDRERVRPQPQRVTIDA